MTAETWVALGALAFTMFIQIGVFAFILGGLFNRVKVLEENGDDHRSTANEVIRLRVEIELFGKRLDEIARGLTWLTQAAPVHQPLPK